MWDVENERIEGKILGIGTMWFYPRSRRTGQKRIPNRRTVKERIPNVWKCIRHAFGTTKSYVERVPKHSFVTHFLSVRLDLGRVFKASYSGAMMFKGHIYLFILMHPRKSLSESVAGLEKSDELGVALRRGATPDEELIRFRLIRFFCIIWHSI